MKTCQEAETHSLEEKMQGERVRGGGGQCLTQHAVGGERCGWGDGRREAGGRRTRKKNVAN